MLESLRAWPLIKGFRGRKSVANVDRLVEVLLRFSMLVADFPEISELDANPVLVRDDRVIALDARVVVDRAAVDHPATRPYAHLAIRPYPDDLVEKAVLADGTPIIVRPIKPEDEPMWHELLAGCSTKTLWQRFQYLFKSETHEAAIRFCFVDYDRELAAVAEANIDGRRKLLGVARLVGDVTRDRAEFAILVGEPWQGKGLGKVLTEYCLKHADRIEAREVYGITHRTNDRMIKLFKQFGFEIGPDLDPTLLLATQTLH